MWGHILFGGNQRRKEIMGQSFVCSLVLDGERRGEIRTISTSKSLHLGVCARMSTHEQGISISVITSDSQDLIQFPKHPFGMGSLTEGL